MLTVLHFLYKLFKRIDGMNTLQKKFQLFLTFKKIHFIHLCSVQNHGQNMCICLEVKNSPAVGNGVVFLDNPLESTSGLQE
jgi:hypothetical protein